VKPPRSPSLDNRRTAEFSAELRERAQAWIPSWGLNDSESDFGAALLEIAARFSAEVAERFDGAGEKMRRGFLDWLAVRGEAARPARVPVVFKLAETAQEAVLASAPVRLQADAGDATVVFETENDVRVMPGLLELVVGADADADAFYLPPPGLSDLTPLEPIPTAWQLKSLAAAGAQKVQLDPETGLTAEIIVLAGGQQYRVTQVDKDIVTIDPPLAGELPAGSPVLKVTRFAPFDGVARNRQEHALYLGHLDLLNIEAAATLSIVGAKTLSTGMTWQYWGKVDGSDEIGWQALTVVDDPRQPAAVVLKKPAGAIEPRELKAGINSRWIRAYTSSVTGAPPALRSLEIRVNYLPVAACPPAASAMTPSPAAEAMSNTTPLVLDNVFFPLGKEPRQFDAFYLGSQEAFSKKGAKVQLCFEMADPSFSSLTALRSGFAANVILAGVAADGQLHLFQFAPATGSLTRLLNRVPLRPPTPVGQGAPAPTGGPSVVLDPRPAFRVPVWLNGTNLFVAVAAKGAVWLWHENGLAPNLSGWLPLEVVEPVADPAKPIDGLTFLTDDSFGQLFALRDSRLFVRNLNTANGTWEPVETTAGGAPVKLAKITPICLETGDLGNGTLAEGLVGISDDNKLYGIALSGTPLKGTCTKLLDHVATAIAPSAVRRQDQRLVAIAAGTQAPRSLVAFLSQAGVANFAPQGSDDVELDWETIIGGLIDVNVNATALTVVVSVEEAPGSTVLASWVPFASAGLDELFKMPIPSTLGAAAGAPTLMPKHVLVPTSTSQVVVADFDLTRRIEVLESLRTALIAVDAPDRFAIGDQLAIPTDSGGGSTKYELRTVVAAGVEFRGKALYEFNLEAIDDLLFVYRISAPVLVGTVDATDLGTLEIDGADPDPDQFDLLLITTDASTLLYEVQDFDPITRVATLDRDLDVANPSTPPATVSYVAPETSNATVLPLLHLTPATTGNWQASVLDRVSLFFPGADPEFQRGTAFKVDAGRPELVVLGEHWHVKPPVAGGKVKFIVDGTLGKWTVQLGDASTNPELSWEYWNGKGWWGLDVTLDATLNLKKSGAVRFDVPADIASSDWAGKTNHWIRARLIGGDYGREKITTKSKTVGDVTEQTIDRSLEGIRPPSVVKLHISYRVCEGVQPPFVLAQDSGSIRDQSDANRTAGAIVDAFVPLGVTLGRLANAQAAAEDEDECPPECQCHGQPAETAGTTPAVVPSAAPVTARSATGRSILIGLTAAPSEAPVNILLLVDAERDHTVLAPMTIEALVADRFVPIVAEDKTRALGESGLLSMTFAVKPTPRELFGRTLTWLRLTPAAGGTGTEWKPTLRGAYLNAVWAGATETLTRELLGSSDGAPNLTFTLARPPVLHDTLELRVKEPLGDEDRAALRRGDERRVLSDVEELPGDWVLWTRVLDPGDESPSARVYALDEATGEIRFGDGLHGAIPPVGRDSIVAFSYQRTEPGAPGSDIVPANGVTARTAFNLVSPVESVEAVIAADQAAGGAPPESDDRVLRFGFARLRHRKRAVSARDLEDLALGSSPEIVQARCLVRGDRVRLVVVMRGKGPQPSAAQIRELRRLLLDAAPPLLAALNALRIEGPVVRRLRTDLDLRVSTLDHAGAVAQEVKKRLIGLFDPATGGADKDGWALGENPTEGDIALALIDTPRLDSIAGASLREYRRDGREGAWPDTIKANELVMLAADPVRIHFATAEVGV
jgi:hypothetical protein